MKGIILYSLSVLMRAGIRDILIIVPESYTNSFKELLDEEAVRELGVLISDESLIV